MKLCGDLKQWRALNDQVSIFDSAFSSIPVHDSLVSTAQLVCILHHSVSSLNRAYNTYMNSLILHRSFVFIYSLARQIHLLAKRRAQLKKTIQTAVQEAMLFLDATPDQATKLELIETLRTVAAGKIYVEIELARLTMTLAKIKEAQVWPTHH